MVVNKGVYTLKKTREPEDPESSHSRSSIGEVSLTFYDDQPPLGEDDLYYVPRRWDIIQECEKRLECKPPDKSFRATFSRLPAARRKRPARQLTSSPVSAREPLQTCWKEKPPDNIIYDDNANEVITNLYKMDPVEDLNNLVEKFSLLHTVCQDTVVSNCYSYSKCNLDSGMNEIVVHNSVIPSVMAPDINTVYNNATAD